MKAHRKLKTWNLGCSLVDRIYDLTAEFPAAEKFNLTSQLRRAAVSIPSNIAEGNGRRTTKDYLSFLYRARGSIRELDTQLAVSANQGYLKHQNTIPSLMISNVFQPTSKLKSRASNKPGKPTPRLSP
jgi:four helix bundle protein